MIQFWRVNILHDSRLFHPGLGATAPEIGRYQARAFGGGPALPQIREKQLVQELGVIVPATRIEDRSVSSHPASSRERWSMLATWASLNLAQAAVSLSTMEITGRDGRNSRTKSSCSAMSAVLSQLIWITRLMGRTR